MRHTHTHTCENKLATTRRQNKWRESERDREGGSMQQQQVTERRRRRRADVPFVLGWDWVMTRRSVCGRLPPSLLPVDAAGGFDRETEGERGRGQTKTGLAVTLGVCVHVGGGEGTKGEERRKKHISGRTRRSQAASGPLADNGRLLMCVCVCAGGGGGDGG